MLAAILEAEDLIEYKKSINEDYSEQRRLNF
jgi:hypothetical protein